MNDENIGYFYQGEIIGSGGIRRKSILGDIIFGVCWMEKPYF